MCTCVCECAHVSCTLRVCACQFGIPRDAATHTHAHTLEHTHEHTHAGAGARHGGAHGAESTKIYTERHHSPSLAAASRFAFKSHATKSQSQMRRTPARAKTLTHTCVCVCVRRVNMTSFKLHISGFVCKRTVLTTTHAHVEWCVNVRGGKKHGLRLYAAHARLCMSKPMIISLINISGGENHVSLSFNRCPTAHTHRTTTSTTTIRHLCTQSHKICTNKPITTTTTRHGSFPLERMHEHTHAHAHTQSIADARRDSCLSYWFLADRGRF